MDVYDVGGRPVFYGKTVELKKMLSPDEYWRIVDFDLPFITNKDETTEITDWTHEREWRVPNDFEFKYERIEIILSNYKYYKKFIEWCENEKHMDVLRNIKGIVLLDSIIC